MRMTREMERILETTTLDILRNEASKNGETLLIQLQKLIPLEPVKTGVDMVNGYILDQYACPVCDRPIGDEMMMFNYCPGCGQKVKDI